MSYSVVDIFDTLQGEGVRAGSRSIFIRLAGCNLWDGLEAHRDRGKGACARWCDTDFAKGKAMAAEAIAAVAWELWCAPLAAMPNAARRQIPASWLAAQPWVVITGGEPSLQLDMELLDALRAKTFRVAVESNGTRRTDALLAVDHLCISPKLGSQLAVFQADELKVVVPGVRPVEASPRDASVSLLVPFPKPTRGLQSIGAGGWTAFELDRVADLGEWGALFIAPQDGPDRAANVAYALDVVRCSPRWRLSVQTHKVLGIP